MFTDGILNRFRKAGRSAIAAEHVSDQTVLPLEQDGVVFRQMFEYPVADFETEVGFYANVFGFPTIALSTDYALFTHPREEFCFSFRHEPNQPHLDLSSIKLLFMTANLESADAHLEQTGLVPNREIRPGSPVQRVVHFRSPAGIAIEIWEDPSPGQHEQ